MSVEIIVPQLGESVSEATIAKWYKKPGDNVKLDELLLELETEKVTLEVNSTAEGVLESALRGEGDTVTPGEKLGVIKAGASSAKKEASSDSSALENKVIASANEKTHNEPSANDNKGGADFMGPAARKIIAENSLDSANIKGTGKDGRVTKGDALNSVGSGSNASSSSSSSSSSSGHAAGSKEVEIVKMSRLRKTIAQRLKDSQNTAAILSTFNEIDMSNVMNLRKKMRDEFGEKHGVKLGFMSFFVKAVVNALKAVPSVNAEINGDEIIYKKYYDIGVAVGTEQGLVVPVVQDCDKKSFADIEKNIVDLAGKARSGKLAMSDLMGGTFSITNGGVYGSLLSTPIINPPQTAIIGLHNTQERPVAIDGKVEIRPMMYIALSYDHRIIDGKDAVTFLINVKKAIEQPERLLFDM